MSISLLSLPNELLIAVLSNLSAIDIYGCVPVCKTLRSLIQSSSELKYAVAIELAGCDDVPSSSLGNPAKMEKLKEGREAWHSLQPRFVKQVDVKHTPSGIYDLASGIYLLGDESRHSLYYIDLPESDEDPIEWKIIKVKESIIDMGLAVDEHDLIAVVTTSLVLDAEPARFEISMHLLQFSTGEPHPDAKVQRIIVHKNKFERPAIGIEIVGDNIILILTHYRMGGHHQPDDRLFVYDWKTGRLKMTLVAPYRSFSGPIPLTEHLFILPNSKKGLLEVWDIPRVASEPSPSSPACSLALPTLAPGRAYSSISCRGEPNPTASSSRPESKYRPRAYQANAADAILIFNVTVDPVLNRQAVEIGHTYSFFVHRKNATRVAEETIAGGGDKYRSGNRTNGTMPPTTLPVGTPPVDIHHPSSSEAELGEVIVPWTEWGAKCTRWFEVDRFPTRWITTTAGQRAVFMGRDAGEETTVIVFDFNQWNVKRTSWVIKEKREKRRQEEEEKKASTSEDAATTHEGKEVEVEERDASEGAGAGDKVKESAKGKAVDPRERGELSSALSNTEAEGISFHPNLGSQDDSPGIPISESPSVAHMADLWSPVDFPVLDAEEDNWIDETDGGDDGDDGWGNTFEIEEQDEGSDMVVDADEDGGGEWQDENDDEDEGEDVQFPTAQFTMANFQTLNINPVFLQMIFGNQFNPANPNQFFAHIQNQGPTPAEPSLIDHLGEMMQGPSEETAADGDGENAEKAKRDEPATSTDDEHGKTTTVYTGPNQVDKYGRSFESPVTSELPFVQHVAKYKVDTAYDGMLMDEERILGIVTDHFDVIRKIDIHYFG